MKTKQTSKWPKSKAAAAPLTLKEARALPGVGVSVPVRIAKAKLSALLEWVAQGRTVTITSDGIPKAVLSPVASGHERKRFGGMGDFLLSQPVHGGPSA